jgi:hypothetical protein
MPSGPAKIIRTGNDFATKHYIISVAKLLPLLDALPFVVVL